MSLRTLASDRIPVAVYFALIGLTLQTVAIVSNSWILIERIEPVHCRPNRTIRIFYDSGCNAANFNTSEIARAGIWSVCYKFPHIYPQGHTDPFCADFADDFFQIEGLALLQMLCILSMCSTTFGLLIIAFVRIVGMKNAALSSAAFSFMATSGICGLAGCICVHVYMVKEYMVYYEKSRMVLFKWWGFHAFLDGSILNLVSWLLNGWYSRRFRSVH